MKNLSLLLVLVMIVARPLNAALDIAHGTSDRVVITTNAGLDDLATQTVIAWVFSDGLSNDNMITSKQGGSHNRFFRVQGVNGDFSFISQRDTVATNATSNDTPVNTGEWSFLARTNDLDGADADQKLFYGNLTTVVAEVGGYSTQLVGSGAKDDAGGDIAIGGLAGGQTFGAWDGKIAFVAHWNRELTLGELKVQQYRPHKTSGCLFFIHLGFNGTGTQVDWSGTGNDGTVTGTTVAAHVPLGPPFGAEIPILFLGCVLWLNRKKAA